MEEKNKFHALQLFTDTFAAETVHLTNEQVGIYIRLLCFAWTKNAKPFTRISAERICQCVDEKCKNTVNDILNEFFRFNKEDGTWTHKRLVQEHEYLTAKYKARSEAGRKGGLARSKTEAPIPIPSPIPKKYIYDDSFTVLWSSLKKVRGSKKRAHEIFQKTKDFFNMDLDDVANIYNVQIENIEDKFVPHFSTWLSQHRWENTDNVDNSLNIIKKMEKVGYEFMVSKPRFHFFRKGEKTFKIDRYDKEHLIQEVE